MLYILATWTGYRRKELGSLTLESFRLENNIPFVRVGAGDSKRKRKEAIPLHEYVVAMFKEWVEDKNVSASEPLFNLNTPKGPGRKTAKMMQRDLAAARASWIEEAKSEEEKERRQQSDFLRYQDASGEFADFHANRHTFISKLSRARLPLSMAQKLARHSDPRLTLNRYTHLELEDKAAAIAELPSPEKAQPTEGLKAWEDHQAVPPTEKASVQSESVFTAMFTGTVFVGCHVPSQAVTVEAPEASDPTEPNSFEEQEFGTESHQMSLVDQVHPRGLEPLTFGSVGSRSNGEWRMCLGGLLVSPPITTCYNRRPGKPAAAEKCTV